MQSEHERHFDQKHRGVMAGALALVFGLGVIDYVTGYELGFFVFYYIPIAIAAWRGTRRFGLGVAIVSGVTWLGSDILSGHEYSSPVLQGWNTAVRGAAFLVFAFMTATVRERLEEQKRLTAELSQALSEVKQLKGLLPVCAWCKNVRNDDGYWEQMEAYVASRTDAEFTHSICPECARKLGVERR